MFIWIYDYKMKDYVVAEFPEQAVPGNGIPQYMCAALMNLLCLYKYS